MHAVVGNNNKKKKNYTEFIHSAHRQFLQKVKVPWRPMKDRPSLFLIGSVHQRRVSPKRINPGAALSNTGVQRVYTEQIGGVMRE